MSWDATARRPSCFSGTARKDPSRLRLLGPPPLQRSQCPSRRKSSQTAPRRRLSLRLCRSRAAMSRILRRLSLAPPYISRDGTTLMQGARQLKFHGIEGPRASEVCLDEEGKRWACGLQARAALHNLLAGGSLTCTPQLALGSGNVSVSCLVKNTVDGSAKDVAQALVGRGWARPAVPGAVLDEALAAAQRERAGLWRGDWTVSPVVPVP